MNTALNRTTVALLTNKSGGSVAQGDVVIVDSATVAAFTTTTTGAYVSGSVGVVLEPNGIASNAIGTVAFGGYVPIVNLSGSASLGDVFKTHTVAKQAVRHAGPIVTGDFGQVLGTGTTPAALLWGEPSGGGGGGGAPTGSAGGDLGGTYPNPTVSHPAELGYVQVTTPQTGIPSSVADLTSLTLTVTVGTRAIVVEAYIPLFDVTGSSAGRMQLQIIDVTASNAVIGVGYAVTAGSNGGTGAAAIRVAPSAGSRTYKLAAACDAGTTGRAFCGSTQPMWLRIYEV